MVQVDSILTETKVVDQCPEISAINDHEMERNGEREHTSMRLKDSWIYVCMATIARKYIVASATIVRTNAESLSALLLQYVYQTMTRNADSSKCSPRSVIRGILPQRLERVQLRTERGANRSRNQHELEVYNDRAQVESVDWDWREIYDHRRFEER
jgi:hypothetical protein